MGTCLVVVEKSFNGVKFVNTHAVWDNRTEGTMSPQEMAELIQVPFLSNTGDLLDGPVNSILWSILEFERLLYSNIVRFTRVLITDRRNFQPGPDQTRAFKGYTLNYSGASNYSTFNSVDAGDHILSITRNAVFVGAEDGEIEYRMLLNKEDHVASGDRLLAWASDSTRLTWGNKVGTALNQSQLENYFGDTSLTGIHSYVIPRYTDRNSTTVDSDIRGLYICGGFSVLGPLSRQVRKGRRKKKTTT